MSVFGLIVFNLCHPPHADKSPLTQYEGASLCGLLSSQLCVLLWVVKLQWFHEGLKASLALTAQNVQQTTCSMTGEKTKFKKKKNGDNVELITIPGTLSSTVTTQKNKKTKQYTDANSYQHFGNYHSWNCQSSHKMQLLWCGCHYPCSYIVSSMIMMNDWL